MTAEETAFELRLAADARDLRAAQRLRYDVFVGEMGSDGPLIDHDARLERDDFDTVCDHLLLIDRRRDPALLQDVVGVYRLLPGTGSGRGRRSIRKANMIWPRCVPPGAGCWNWAGLACIPITGVGRR